MLIPKLLEWEDFGHEWLTCLCYARNIFRCLQKEDRPEDEDEVSYFTKLVFWSQSYSTFGFLDCRYAVASLERLHESMLPSKKRLGRREHGATGAKGAMRYEFLLPRSLQQGFYCSNLKEFRPKSPQRVVQVLVTWWLFLTAHCRLCDYYVQDGPEEFFDHDIWYWVIIIKRVNLGLLDLLLPCLSPGGWRSPAGNRTAHLRTAGRNTPCCLAQVDSMCNYETSQRDLLGFIRPQELLSFSHPAKLVRCFVSRAFLVLVGESGVPVVTYFNGRLPAFHLDSRPCKTFSVLFLFAPSLKNTNLGNRTLAEVEQKVGKLRSGIHHRLSDANAKLFDHYSKFKGSKYHEVELIQR